jgi:hypothetical protein
MAAFWDRASCSVGEVNRCFRDAYCLHHQGDESITALMMEVICTCETSVYFMRLHGAISQKAAIFKVYVVTMLF